jgi:glycosyltransferase involved in cell wall biosynthesis
VSSDAGDVWLLDHSAIRGGGQRFGLRLVEALREAGRNAAVAEDLRLPTPAPWNPAVLSAVQRTRRFLAGLDEGATLVANHPRVHAYLYAAGRRPSGPAIVNIAHEQESAGRGIARFAYRRFGSLVVIGANAASEYESRLPGVQLTKINNFLPVEFFDRAHRERVLSPAHADLSVGVMARLIPEKGVVELIEELADPAVRSAWRELVVAGGRQDAAYAESVERRIGELGLDGRVRLIGETEDVPGFLSSVDVLVVPSTGKEAQPTAIIEALAYGVPVVVREALLSPDFEGLPVSSYGTPGDLGAALRAPRPAAAHMAELISRFGPDQAIAGIDAAAQLARARS